MLTKKRSMRPLAATIGATLPADTAFELDNAGFLTIALREIVPKEESPRGRTKNEEEWCTCGFSHSDFGGLWLAGPDRKRSATGPGSPTGDDSGRFGW
jgi:hypothetical protein